MCFPGSKRRERGPTKAASSSNEYDNDDGTKVRHRRHLWSTIGLCGSSFSMFYLIMNVFPYSGFMALHLLNGKTENENDRNNTKHQILHVTAATIGPYAGILASSFRLGRIPTAILWGRCADIYGRKFSLVVCTLAMIAGNILFALAPTFSVAVAVRFGAGLLNGTMVIVRTSISEIAWGDRELESRGVAMLSSVSGYAMLLAPAIGGLLSNPIKLYPSYFSNDPKNGTILLFWKNVLTDYPFLLPNLIGSFVATTSLLIVIFYVEETLPDDRRRDWRLIPSDLGLWISSIVTFHKKKQSSFAKRPSSHEMTTEERTPLIGSSENQRMISHSGLDCPQIMHSTSSDEDMNNITRERRKKKSTFASFLDSTSNVKFFFYSMWLFAFSSLATLETFPLFAITSISEGGLGFDATRIGIVQTIGGCVFVVGQYSAFSTAIKHLGVMKALRFSTFGRIFIVLLFPLAMYFSTPIDSECEIQTDTSIMVGNNSMNCAPVKNWYQLGYLGLVTGIKTISGSIFMGSSTIGVNTSLTDASQRASMNGLQSMVASIGRGVGPIVAGYLVAATMKTGTIPASASAWVVYGVLMIMESVTHWSTRIIPDESIDTNDKDDDEKHEEAKV